LGAGNVNCDDNKEAISAIALKTKELSVSRSLGKKKESNEQRAQNEVIERRKIKFFGDPSASNSCLGDTKCFSPSSGYETFSAYISSLDTERTGD